jgi:ATP-dependent DNA helicase
LNYLFPDLFDDATTFDSIYDSKTYNVNSDKLLKVPILLDSFMLRRVKKELDLPIPQKTEIKVYLPLTKLQTDVYKSLLINSADLLQTVRQKGKQYNECEVFTI